MSRPPSASSRLIKTDARFCMMRRKKGRAATAVAAVSAVLLMLTNVGDRRQNAGSYEARRERAICGTGRCLVNCISGRDSIAIRVFIGRIGFYKVGSGAAHEGAKYRKDRRSVKYSRRTRLSKQSDRIPPPEPLRPTRRIHAGRRRRYTTVQDLFKQKQFWS